MSFGKYISKKRGFAGDISTSMVYLSNPLVFTCALRNISSRLFGLGTQISILRARRKYMKKMVELGIVKAEGSGRWKSY